VVLQARADIYAKKGDAAAAEAWEDLATAGRSQRVALRADRVSEEQLETPR
jgi:hypothetical protein